MANTARDRGGGLAQALVGFAWRIRGLQISSFVHRHSCALGKIVETFTLSEGHLALNARRWRSVSSVMQPSAGVTGE